MSACALKAAARAFELAAQSELQNHLAIIAAGHGTLIMQPIQSGSLIVKAGRAVIPVLRKLATRHGISVFGVVFPRIVSSWQVVTSRSLATAATRVAGKAIVAGFIPHSLVLPAIMHTVGSVLLGTAIPQLWRLSRPKSLSASGGAAGVQTEERGTNIAAKAYFLAIACAAAVMVVLWVLLAARSRARKTSHTTSTSAQSASCSAHFASQFKRPRPLPMPPPMRPEMLEALPVLAPDVEDLAEVMMQVEMDDELVATRGAQVQWVEAEMSRILQEDTSDLDDDEYGADELSLIVPPEPPPRRIRSGSADGGEATQPPGEAALFCHLADIRHSDPPQWRELEDIPELELAQVPSTPPTTGDVFELSLVTPPHLPTGSKARRALSLPICKKRRGSADETDSIRTSPRTVTSSASSSSLASTIHFPIDDHAVPDELLLTP